MVSHPRRRDARRHGARRHRHPNRQSWDNCHATYWLLSARVGRGPPPPTTYYEVLLPSGGTGWVPVTAARLEAELVIDRWNRRLATGRDMLSSPTIRAALVADTPWLDVFCPGCGTSRRLICAPSTVTHWLRSARWCAACGVRGVRDRRRCRSCLGFTRCHRQNVRAPFYKDARRRLKSTPCLKYFAA
jgi:hypothetical protein